MVHRVDSVTLEKVPGGGGAGLLGEASSGRKDVGVDLLAGIWTAEVSASSGPHVEIDLLRQEAGTIVAGRWGRMWVSHRDAGVEARVGGGSPMRPGPEEVPPSSGRKHVGVDLLPGSSTARAHVLGG